MPAIFAAECKEDPLTMQSILQAIGFHKLKEKITWECCGKKCAYCARGHEPSLLNKHTADIDVFSGNDMKAANALVSCCFSKL